MILSGILGYQYAFFTQKNTLEHAKIDNTTDKTKPILTVAGIVYVIPEKKFALIERGKEPKGLAMFGGHVEKKESPEQAFAREAKEELNVKVDNLKLIGLHGKYGRDSRQHSVEATYFCITKEYPHAGSDAKSVILYSKNELIDLLKNSPQLFAFDHAQILMDFFKNEENAS